MCYTFAVSCERKLHIGLSPSGKATDFDSVTRGFESRQPSQPRASTRNPRVGLYFFYGLVPALIVGIYFVTPHLSKGIEPS